MNAYDESYLDFAMKNLGEAFDYAVNACGLRINRFASLFLTSGAADHFGKGNPKYIAGLSGTELCMEIMAPDENMDFPAPGTDYECSPEYWTGWILAYYQWFTGKTFKGILSDISAEDILKLYPALHEASEEKFADTVNAFIANKKLSTRLQRQRKIYGCSQRELSEKSGVNLRTLQQYELGSKDIKKASAETVLRLANTLGCRVEDIV